MVDFHNFCEFQVAIFFGDFFSCSKEFQVHNDQAMPFSVKIGYNDSHCPMIKIVFEILMIKLSPNLLSHPVKSASCCLIPFNHQTDE